MQPEIKSENIETEKNIQQVSPEVKQEIKEEVKEETQEQINWRKFRQQREIERKQSEENARRADEKAKEAEALKAALESVLNKQPQQQQNNNYYEEEESEDQRIEKKVQIALAKKEQEYQQRRQEEEQRTFPQRLTQAHPDFDSVCNTANLDYLEFHHAEVANAFKYMPDGFEKWSNIYRAVKRYVPSSDVRKEEAKADRNLQKPQSSMHMTSTGNPTSAYRLDEAKKMENYRRMQKEIKSLS